MPWLFGVKTFLECSDTVGQLGSKFWFRHRFHWQWKGHLVQVEALRHSRRQLEEMTNNSKGDPFSINLTSFQEHVGCELMDRKTKLTQSSTYGRHNLDIEELALVIFLSQLQEQKLERLSLVDETRSLKAQLEAAPVKHVQASHPSSEYSVRPRGNFTMK